MTMIQTKSLQKSGCSKSFKEKYNPSIRGKKQKHFLLFILKLFVYFRLFFFCICSSLFTMFESTKFNLFMTVHIYSFLFLYYCSPFCCCSLLCMFFFSPFFFCCVKFCFNSHSIVTTRRSGDDLPVWPSTCELVQNVHADQPISA